MVCVDQLDHIEDIAEPEERKLHHQWRRKGLQEGIRVIRIQEEDITEVDPLNDEISNRFHRQDIENLIQDHIGNVGHEIDITFREDILDVDDSSPLGLTYDAKLDSSHNDSDSETEENKSPESTSKQNKLLGILYILILIDTVY